MLSLAQKISSQTTRLCELDLSIFVRRAWSQVEPSPLVSGWHMDAICDHLQEVTKHTKGDGAAFSKLIINIPPRHSKSLIVSVLWPMWVWTSMPQLRWLFASYAQTLSTRDSLKCRRLIESKWYKDRWGHVVKLASDQSVKQRFENTSGGHRIATSIDGVATGDGGDAIVIDDPHNMKEIHSDAKRGGVISWWRETMTTRLNDQNRGIKVLIMQRGHESDLSGYLLANEKGWEHLMLPAEFEPRRRCVTALGIADHREAEGELLCPERFSRDVLEDLKKSMGSYGSAGQLQQRPAPDDGGFLKRAWWRFYDVLPDDLTGFTMSWDMAFKGDDLSDYTVGQVWARSKANYYLIDQIRFKKEFTGVLVEFESMIKNHPRCRYKYVEAKANGEAVISALRKKFHGIIRVPNKIVASGKNSRVAAVSPIVESGNVYLPNPALHPWVNDFIDEGTVFPNGVNDDQMDAFTAAILVMEKQGRNIVVNGSTH